MKKVYQQMLAEFKRSNKARKESMAKEFGKKNADELLSFLNKKLGIKAETKKADTKGKTKTSKKTTPVAVAESTPEATVSPVVKPTIHNVHILDISTSMMGEKLNSAVIGINNEILALQKDNTVNYTQTTVTFSSANDLVYHSYKLPIKETQSLRIGARGNTALNDAVGNVLSRLEAEFKNGEKVLVKIFTDGEENGSRVFSRDAVASTIKRCEDLGFTITFVGTEYDTNRVIKDFKIDHTNTLVHDNTSRGIADAFQLTRSATMSYASDVKAGKNVLKGFYKKSGTLSSNK